MGDPVFWTGLVTLVGAAAAVASRRFHVPAACGALVSAAALAQALGLSSRLAEIPYAADGVRLTAFMALALLCLLAGAEIQPGAVAGAARSLMIGAVAQAAAVGLAVFATGRALGMPSAEAALLAAAALAQDRWPARPVRVVIPFAPGGGTDVVGRILAARLTERLGQGFIVENRAAGSGIVGADHVAKATPDGHTLLFAFSSLSSSAKLYKSLPYDPINDLAPVALATTSPLVLFLHPSVPARDVAEFVAYAKANPGKLNYGSSGLGSSPTTCSSRSRRSRSACRTRAPESCARSPPAGCSAPT